MNASSTVESFDGEHRLRRLLDSAPVAAYSCDPAGLITHFNQHAVRLWGRIPSIRDPEWRYCGSLRLYAPDRTPIPHNRCWMARALSDGEPFNGKESVIERPDGEFVHALAFANPIFGATGEVVAGVNFLMDVSEDRRAEADILRLRAEIDARAGARVAALVSTLVELQRALLDTRMSNPVIPICAWCKKIRDSLGYWHVLEEYFRDRSGAEFTHGICPLCAARHEDEVEDS